MHVCLVKHNDMEIHRPVLTDAKWGFDSPLTSHARRETLNHVLPPTAQCFWKISFPLTL